jgi:hypothetical protein
MSGVASDHGVVLWFKKTCGNTVPHGLIKKMEEACRRDALTERGIEDLKNTLRDCTDKLKGSDCPFLFARTIQAVKGLAFLDGAERFIEDCFKVLPDWWRKGLERDEARKQEYRDYEPAFDVATFLKGWKKDLDRVVPGALRFYMTLLRLKKVPEDPGFDEAMEAFLDRVETNLDKPENANLVGTIAFAFVNDMLHPLLADRQRNKALEHMKSAARLISQAVRLNPKESLGQDAAMAFDGLGGLCLSAEVPALSDERTGSEKRVADAYVTLNHRRMQMTPHDREAFDLHSENVFPKLGGWEKREVRLAAPGWTAEVRTSEQDPCFEGAVEDICKMGCQIRFFAHSVRHCWPEGEHNIRIDDGGGCSHVVKDLDVTLLDKERVRYRCRGQALRGFMYKATTDSEEKEAGAAFKFLNSPPNLADAVAKLSPKSP